MSFTSDVYLNAAVENLRAARILHEHGDYSLSHYVAGLAVECVLRAYCVRVSTEFDAKHDLRKLYKAGEFGRTYPEAVQRWIVARIDEVYIRWNNNHRFRSEKS